MISITVQHQQSLGGKCGICGDPWDAEPRQHEAPGGAFANGIIAREYRPGQKIQVIVDVTANHDGYFQFMLCANNNTAQDPGQECFDKTVLPVLPDLTDKYYIGDHLGNHYLGLLLPDDVYCDQCILQVGCMLIKPYLFRLSPAGSMNHQIHYRGRFDGNRVARGRSLGNFVLRKAL